MTNPLTPRASASHDLSRNARSLAAIALRHVFGNANDDEVAAAIRRQEQAIGKWRREHGKAG